MSSIPSSAIPHAVDPVQAEAYVQKERPRPLAQALRILAAPSLIALGLSAMALERLRQRPVPATA